MTKEISGVIFEEGDSYKDGYKEGWDKCKKRYKARLSKVIKEIEELYQEPNLSMTSEEFNKAVFKIISKYR